MTEAIRTGSFVNGFTRGMDTVDRHVDRREQRENQREAIQMQKDDQVYNRGRQELADARAEEALQLQRENITFNQNLATENNARLSQQSKYQTQKHEWEAENYKRTQKEQKIADLSSEAGQYFDLFSKGAYSSLDPGQLLDFHQRAVEAGRPTLSPLSWDNETVSRVKKLGPLLQQLKNGDLSHVNAPGNLKILSDLPGWKEKLNQGIGQQGRNGSPIVSKELAELKPGPDGRVVPILKVHTEDGESYTAEMSAFRSTDPNEPVVAADAGNLIENAIGQYMLSNLFSDPAAQQVIAKVRGEMFGAENSGGDQSSTGKTIRDLMHYGVSQQDAIKLATQSKHDPQAAVIKLASILLQDDMRGDPDGALEAARAALQVAPSQPEPTPQRPAESIFKTLRDNPKNAAISDAKLRQAAEAIATKQSGAQ